MPDYVPIQDLTIVGSVGDNDLIPLSDGSGAYAVKGSTLKAFVSADAEAAAASAASAAESAADAVTAAESAESAAQSAASDAETAANAAAATEEATEAAQRAAEAAEDKAEEVEDQLGDFYEIPVDIPYTITYGKKFNNRSPGSAMAFTDNTAYHYIAITVTPGEKYKVKTYFTDSDIYFVYMCDANNIIVKREQNASGKSGQQIFDVSIPDSAAVLYIQGYSNAALIDGRMYVKKYTYPTFRDMLDGAIESVEQTEGEVTALGHKLKSWNHSPYNLTYSYGYMEVTGAVNTSVTNYVFSRGIQVCEPLTLSLLSDGLYFAVNQYDSYNYSSARIIKNWKGYNANPVTIYADSYPIYLRIGVKKTDGSNISSAELDNILEAISFKSNCEPVPFASIAMFPKFAISGCSWDAGTIYGTSDGHVSRTGAGWAEVLGRRNGCLVGNYAIGNSNIRSWFNEGTHPGGFKALLDADAYPLYILTEGNSNDANAFVRNDGSYSPVTPSTTTYYIGSVEDISTREDYHDYPCTFYGYYGRVIEMIQAHAPNTRIIISSPDTTEISSDIRKDLRTACRNIAAYYSLPYMDIETDPYYDTYVNALVTLHPTAPTYSGWAMAIERLFSKTVAQNRGYFDKYSGIAITPVTVAWEPVELPS